MDPQFRQRKKKVGLGIVDGVLVMPKDQYCHKVMLSGRRECQRLYATGHGQSGHRGIERIVLGNCEDMALDNEGSA